MFRRGFLAGAAFLGAAALLPGLALAQNAGPVKVGVITFFGGSQTGGDPVVAAAKLAIDDFGGMALGKKIELLAIDDQQKPDVASVHTRQWLERDGVTAIMVNSNSPVTFAVLDLLKQHNKPLLIAGAGSTDFTGKACSPLSTQFIWDAYSLPRAVVKGLVSKGKKNWYLVRVDNAFGESMEKNLTDFLAADGGKLVGVSRHPLNMTDFSSIILQAQASKADAIGLATTGQDLTNLIKQAKEFGVTQKQSLAAMSMAIHEVHAVGLEAAQGLEMVTPFYHDMNDETRAWTKKYTSQPKAIQLPSLIEAGVYSSVLHYLKAVEAAGTTEGLAVSAKMRSIPINDFEMKDVMIRANGQAMRPMYLMKIKSPAESKYAYDYLKVEAVVPPEEAWRPLSQAGCPAAPGN
jgi:branched-chain amino acid transport system substrate-binding protein